MAERVRPYYPAVFSAVLLILSNWALTSVGFVACLALVPWFASLVGKGGRFGWKSGYRLGLIFVGSQLFWLCQFVVQWTGSWFFGVIPWVLATMYVACYFGLAGVAISRCMTAQQWWAIPLVWAAIELARSFIPMLAFPWGLAANAVHGYLPLVQTAHLGSVYLVSAEVVLVNLILLALWKPELAPRDWTKLGGGVLAGLVLVSLGLYFTPTSGEKYRVMIAQPGVNMAFGDQQRAEDLIRPRLQAALDKAAANQVQLVVMPEGVGGLILMLPPRIGLNFDPNVSAILGAQFSSDQLYQTAFGWDGDWHLANKTRLVIFGEFVPLRSLFPFLTDVFRLPGGDLSAGPHGVQAMQLKKTTVGPMLCFEGLFPDISYRQLLNQSDLLAVMSIDDWYLGSAAPDQLHDAARWRAIETGLPVVRSASMGISDAFDPHGQSVAGDFPIGRMTNRIFEIQVGRRSPWPAATAALFVFWCSAVLVWVLWPRKKVVGAGESVGESVEQ